MSDTRKQLNVRMNPDLYLRLCADAEADDRSINGQVNFIVRRYLDGKS